MKINIKDLKSRVMEILCRLKIAYPNAKCSLNHKNSLQLLVATILSAQCTDERVNIVTASLFKKYKSVDDFANAPIEELMNEVRSTGFYRNKAKNIQGACKMILSKFNGVVPNYMEGLIELNGVARKTANVVLQNAFNVSVGVVVDTHVGRLARRLGLTKNKDAVKIEKDLVKIVHKTDWAIISHLFIAHGRATCVSRKPKCVGCFLEDVCPRII